MTRWVEIASGLMRCNSLKERQSLRLFFLKVLPQEL
jgi:hypothetical protein